MKEKTESRRKEKGGNKTQLYLAGSSCSTASVLNYVQGVQHVHAKEGPASSFTL